MNELPEDLIRQIYWWLLDPEVAIFWNRFRSVCKRICQLSDGQVASIVGFAHRKAELHPALSWQVLSSFPFDRQKKRNRSLALISVPLCGYISIQRREWTPNEIEVVSFPPLRPLDKWKKRTLKWKHHLRDPNERWAYYRLDARRRLTGQTVIRETVTHLLRDVTPRPEFVPLIFAFFLLILDIYSSVYYPRSR